jgi:hypothetical protein
MILPLQTQAYAAGRELTFPIPRNVHVKSISVSISVPVVSIGSTYVVNTLLNGFRLEYKGDTIFNRTGNQLREINELAQCSPTLDDNWTLAPERGYRGSESNYLFIRCAPLLDISIIPTIIGTADIFVVIETSETSPTGKRAVDSQDLIAYGGGNGFRRISIPVRNQTNLYALFVVRDANVLVDSPDAIISIRNETTQKTIIVAQTLLQSEIVASTKFGCVHNVGLYYIPLGVSQNDKESIVIDFTLVTAGVAITVETLMVSAVN